MLLQGRVMLLQEGVMLLLLLLLPGPGLAGRRRKELPIDRETVHDQVSTRPKASGEIPTGSQIGSLRKRIECRGFLICGLASWPGLGLAWPGLGCHIATDPRVGTQPVQHSALLSHCHTVIVSHYWCDTLLMSHTVTVAHCHCDTLVMLHITLVTYTLM